MEKEREAIFDRLLAMQVTVMAVKLENCLGAVIANRDSDIFAFSYVPTACCISYLSYVYLHLDATLHSIVGTLYRVISITQDIKLFACRLEVPTI